MTNDRNSPACRRWTATSTDAWRPRRRSSSPVWKTRVAWERTATRRPPPRTGRGAAAPSPWSSSAPVGTWTGCSWSCWPPRARPVPRRTWPRRSAGTPATFPSACCTLRVPCPTAPVGPGKARRTATSSSRWAARWWRMTWWRQEMEVVVNNRKKEVEKLIKKHGTQTHTGPAPTRSAVVLTPVPTGAGECSLSVRFVCTSPTRLGRWFRGRAQCVWRAAAAATSQDEKKIIITTRPSIIYIHTHTN